MLAESDEQVWIEAKLSTIRTYLSNKFPGYTLTERVHPNLYHTFTVTNIALHKSYGLKLDCARLSDPRNTPERIWLSLTGGFVASSMVSAGNPYYSW
ncbi:MAG: hypothetical protein IPM58_12880 [Nitrospira sp.]|nr:hypothetical protein [Nitrospira sp.]